MIFLSLLFVKHFIADFILQTKYQIENKGIYGNRGGLLHAATHAAGTFIVVYFFSYYLWVPIFIGLLDGIIHYHVDWLKVKINEHFYLRPSDKQFWWTFGADQLLHSLTYVFFTWMMS